MPPRWTPAVVAAALLLVPALTPAPAAAEELDLAGDWGVLTGRTTRPGRWAVDTRLGWPDAILEVRRGVGPTVDVGVRVSVLYGFESQPGLDGQRGLGLAIPVRWNFYRQGRLRLIGHVDPGFVIYDTPGSSAGGPQLPFGLALDVDTSTPLRAGVAGDVHATLLVSGPGSPQLCLGPMVGPYLEWRAWPDVTLGLETRAGAVTSVVTVTTGGQSANGAPLPATTSTVTDTRFATEVRFTVGFPL